MTLHHIRVFNHRLKYAWRSLDFLSTKHTIHLHCSIFNVQFRLPPVCHRHPWTSLIQHLSRNHRRQLIQSITLSCVCQHLYVNSFCKSLVIDSIRICIPIHIISIASTSYAARVCCVLASVSAAESHCNRFVCTCQHFMSTKFTPIYYLFRNRV